MVVFKPCKGGLEGETKRIKFYADKNAMFDDLQKNINGKIMIDEDEVQDLSIGCEHLQAMVGWNEEQFFGIIGYCDYRTFEQLPCKSDDEKKFTDFCNNGVNPTWLLLLLLFALQCNWGFGSPAYTPKEEPKDRQ